MATDQAIDQAGGVPLPEAARRLGVTENALRKRVQRGTVPAAKGADERWYVFLDDQAGGQGAGQDAGQATDQAAARPDRTDDLIDALQAEVTWLREQMSFKDQTITALAARVADLADRLPELASGQDAPVTRPEAPGATEPPRSASDTLALRWRRWLRRMVG